MLLIIVNNQTPETLITTYKTWFDSDGVLNEWELEWEKGTQKEERKCETNKERQRGFYTSGKKKNKKRMPVGQISNTGKVFLNLFE